MADSGWGLLISCICYGEYASLPATSTNTHGHDPVLVGLSTFLVGLKSGRHIIIRDKGRVDQ